MASATNQRWWPAQPGGATVYCTGRSTRGRRSDYNRPETIEDTAELVTAAGGRGIPVDPARRANRLPTPAGAFRPLLRYELPPISRVR